MVNESSIIRQNIQRLQTRLKAVSDAAERKKLRELLLRERAKLFAFYRQEYNTTHSEY